MPAPARCSGRSALARQSIEPFAGLAHVHLDTTGFTESGGASALSTSGARQDTGYSTNASQSSGQLVTWVVNAHGLFVRVAGVGPRFFIAPVNYLPAGDVRAWLTPASAKYPCSVLSAEHVRLGWRSAGAKASSTHFPKSQKGCTGGYLRLRARAEAAEAHANACTTRWLDRFNHSRMRTSQ
jgi:hypothetical protein